MGQEWNGVLGLSENVGKLIGNILVNVDMLGALPVLRQTHVIPCMGTTLLVLQQDQASIDNHVTAVHQI